MVNGYFTLMIIRGAQALRVVQEALRDALGENWHNDLTPEVAGGLHAAPPLSNILFLPFVIRPRDVERLGNISYGPTGRENTLDLYRSRRRPTNAPLEADVSTAPPLFIAHGSNDSVAPVESARTLATRLKNGSPNPVVYVERPGGQHAFDLFYSLRYSAVVDGLEAFAAWLNTRGAN